ncbi:PASTA domain-containing protein [Bifidobacterium callimiconis]|uniref:PASTA domain-containing protein n=1 Tax=Bifidobacterium callimiconis TaxID=2306973 RepID=UPI001BDBC355|nr:PASTA domain-containing protein [Bifidobacterium callimiconis]
MAVVLGALFFTYHQGWQRNEAYALPAASEIPQSNGSSTTGDKNPTAVNVVAELRRQGIKTKVQKVYSGKTVGAFTGYDGMKPGDTVKNGQTVTVNESMGPGVPKGTEGSKAADVVTTLKDMNVPVTFHQMPVTDTSKHPEGTVLATYPADGAAVTDKSTGIQVGVATATTQVNTVGYDVIGMDKDEAQSKFVSQGLTVTMTPRFSSKQYLGKIVDSEPKPGVVRSAGSAVTLYYGVDASQKNDVVGQELGYGSTDIAMTNTTALAGKYCTDNGDCVTLKTAATSSKPYTLAVDGQQNVGDYGSDTVWDGLSLCAYSQDAYGCVPNPSASYMTDSMKDFLIDGDTGAMELFSGFGLPNCGDNPFVGDGPVSCVNGKTVFGTSGISGASGGQSDLTYVPKEFFVVMPVGADLDKLKADGYFDGSSDYKPNANRVYLIRRDNSAYKTVKADNGSTLTADPYSPGPSMKPFKQAPNANNVYYLVEGLQDIDWSSLPGIDVTPSSSASSDAAKQSADTSSNSAKKTDSSVDAASKEAFSTLAGDYVYSASGDGSTMFYMTVKSDGSFTGRMETADMNQPGTSVATAPRINTPFNGRFSSAVKNSDDTYTLQCDASAFAAEESREKLGFTTCDKFTAYPPNSPVSVLGDKAENYNLIKGFPDSLKSWTIVDNEQSGGIYERQ